MGGRRGDVLNSLKESLLFLGRGGREGGGILCGQGFRGSVPGDAGQCQGGGEGGGLLRRRAGGGASRRALEGNEVVEKR